MLRDEGSYWASDRGQQGLRWPFETVWRRLGTHAPLMALWRKFWGLKANTAKFSTNDGEQGQKTFFLIWGLFASSGPKTAFVRLFGRSIQHLHRGTGGERGGVPSMTAFSVPQHKPICTIAFGGSVRIARVSACLRKGRASLFSRES